MWSQQQKFTYNIISWNKGIKNMQHKKSLVGALCMLPRVQNYSGTFL